MTKKKKRERELEKLHETEDEKRARRLAKKAAKAEKQRALLGGYSNESNPWNDASLTDQFVWSKKVDKDRTMGISSDSAEAQKRRREAQVEELKKMALASAALEFETELRKLHTPEERVQYLVYKTQTMGQGHQPAEGKSGHSFPTLATCIRLGYFSLEDLKRYGGVSDDALRFLALAPDLEPVLIYKAVQGTWALGDDP